MVREELDLVIKDCGLAALFWICVIKKEKYANGMQDFESSTLVHCFKVTKLSRNQFLS